MLHLMTWQTRRTNTVPFSYKCFTRFTLTYNFCDRYVDLYRLKEFVEYNTNSWSIVRHVLNITPTGSVCVSVTIRCVLYNILHSYSVKSIMYQNYNKIKVLVFLHWSKLCISIWFLCVTCTKLHIYVFITRAFRCIGKQFWVNRVLIFVFIWNWLQKYSLREILKMERGKSKSDQKYNQQHKHDPPQWQISIALRLTLVFVSL